jgi:hypothetical protein
MIARVSFDIYSSITFIMSSMKGPGLALLLLATTARSQSGSAEVERLQLVQERASALLANVPAYTCLETVSRMERGPIADGKLVDVVRVAVAFVDHEVCHFRARIDGGKIHGFPVCGPENLNGEAVFRYDFQTPYDDTELLVRSQGVAETKRLPASE